MKLLPRLLLALVVIGAAVTAVSFLVLPVNEELQMLEDYEPPPMFAVAPPKETERRSLAATPTESSPVEASIEPAAGPAPVPDTKPQAPPPIKEVGFIPAVPIKAVSQAPADHVQLKPVFQGKWPPLPPRRPAIMTVPQSFIEDARAGFPSRKNAARDTKPPRKVPQPVDATVREDDLVKPTARQLIDSLEN